MLSVLLSWLGRRRHKNIIVEQPESEPACAPSYLDVGGVSLKGSNLTVSITSGASFKYRCGSRPTRSRPHRLVYTERTHRDHEELMSKLTRNQPCPFDSPEMATLLAPALIRWSTGKTGLDVLELGPAHTAEIPEALEPYLASYTAVDYSEPFLRKQRELLAERPALLALSRHIVANTYELSLPPRSCDLVFVSCHPPLVSASVQDKIHVIDTLHALLRQKGVLALFPWYFKEQPLEATSHLLKRFTPRQIAFEGAYPSRLLLFLEKREDFST